MALTPEDQHRLNALKRFFVLDHAPSEDELGRLVRFTGQLFGVKFAGLAIRSDDDVEKIVAMYGMEDDDLPEDALLIEKPTGPSIPVTVADASTDDRFARNPFVHGESGAKMFAGVPLKSAEGFTLGTLAIMDPTPQEMNGEGVAMLAEIGALVEPVLQLSEARRDRDLAQAALLRRDALSAASVAAAEALSDKSNGVSAALAVIVTACAARRAALFAYVSGAGGQLVAKCLSIVSQDDSPGFATIGVELDIQKEGLLHWADAFATRTPITETPTAPFFADVGVEHLAGVTLGEGNQRPGFVLFDRTEPWTEAELAAVQASVLPFNGLFSQTVSQTVHPSVEQSTLGVLIVTGLEGEIVSANAAASELLDAPEGGIDGMKLVEFVDPKNKDQASNFLANAPHDTPHPFDTHITTTTGSERYMRLLANPITFEGQAAAQIILQDVSVFQRRINTLTAAQHHAEDIARSKSGFLAQMSHEIRTALTSIIGYTEFLVDDLGDDSRDMADTILASSDRLLSTLNSVMDMSRLEATGGEAEIDIIPVGPLVQEAYFAHHTLAEVKELAFVVEGTDLPANAWADAGALARVLDNLISNAIKFTDNGGIRIRVSTGDDWVCVEVQDTGVGIDEAFLPRLFTEFEREEAEQGRSEYGSGLGLALTKRLIDLMGGQVTVTSRKGQGSVFRVVLRAAPISVEQRGDGAVAEAVPSQG